MFSQMLYQVVFPEQVAAAIQQDLPKVMTKMRLYLQNPSTRMILFKPIKYGYPSHICVHRLFAFQFFLEISRTCEL